MAAKVAPVEERDRSGAAAESPAGARLSRWRPRDDTFRNLMSTLVAVTVAVVAVVADLGGIGDSAALDLLVYWDALATVYLLLILLALRSPVP